MTPRLVRAYLERALPGDGRVPRQVRIAQVGEMWLRPGANARRFTATQHIAVERSAFSWRARFPVAGPLAMSVSDGFDAGAGALDVRVLGVRVQRQRGPEVSAGEALRYLAELPWVPYAMLHNTELRWSEPGPRRLEAGLRGSAATVAFELDEAGDIVRMSSPARPLRLAGRWVQTPWGGEFAAHGELGGMRMPRRAEVYWELPSGRFTYWRAEVVAATALDTPFGR